MNTATLIANGTLSVATAQASATLIQAPCVAPPTISGPGDLTVDATTPAGAAVTFSVNATGGSPVCTTTSGTIVASGDVFPIGTTEVTCTVTNAAGSASTTFTVTVLGAADQLGRLLGQTTVHSLAVKLEHASGALANGQTNVACNALNAFTQEAKAQAGHQISAGDAAALVASAARISAVLAC